MTATRATRQEAAAALATLNAASELLDSLRESDNPLYLQVWSLKMDLDRLAMDLDRLTRTPEPSAAAEFMAEGRIS